MKLMYLYITGVVRNVEDRYSHGKIAKIDWDSGKIVKTIDRVFPTPHCARNSNPRGGTRGWRGIVKDQNSSGIIVASNDSLVYFTEDLELKKVITHPAFGNIHGLSYISGLGLCIASTLNDTWCIYDGNTITVHEPLAHNTMYSCVKEWLKLRDRERKPFDSERDYREEWIEDTLHLNYITKTSDGAILALFNSMNLLVRLSPDPKILWSPPLKLGKLEAPTHMLALQCPHDLVYLDEENLLINSSARQELYKFDLVNNSLDLIWGYKEKNLEWNRGLDIVGESIFMGTGNGTIIEIDIASREEITRRRVFADNEFPYSVFGLLAV